MTAANAARLNNMEAGIVAAYTQGTGTLVNADLAAGAAIAYSKLALALGIVNGDISASAAIALSKLADPGTGKVVTSAGAGAVAAFPPSYEIGYDQITSPVNVVSTNSASPTSIIAGTAHTYENVAYLFHFYTMALTVPSTTGGFVVCLLMEDGNPVGSIGQGVNDATGGSSQFPVAAFKRHTPAAGSHTYSLAAYCSATTGTPSIAAGAGTTTTNVPAFLRATKC